LLYMAKVGGGSGLNLTARLNTSEALQKAKEFRAELKKTLGDFSIASPGGMNGGFDTKPITSYQQAQLALKKTLIDAQAESQRLRNENVALSNSYKQGQISAQQLSAAEKQNRKDRLALAEATKAARLAQVAANGSYDEANNRLKALGRSIKAAEGGFESTSPAIRAQISEYNKLNDALKKFDDDMGNHQRHVGGYKGALSDVVGELATMAAGYLTVQAALSAVNATFNAALKNSATRASLDYTLGSAQATDDKLHTLADTANRLGVNFEVMTDSYAKFAGAAKASNFPLDQTDKIFNSIVGAGARFHLTADQISGSLLAVQQMISKGTVQSEELRGQLSERLPGAFSIAARAMGVTEMQLVKLLQSGQVLAADLLPKLSTELDKTFNLDKTTQVESLQASVSKLGNTFTEAVSEQSNLATFFQKFIDNVTLAATAITKLINSNSWSEFWYRLTQKSQDGIGEAMHNATIAEERIANVQYSAGTAINRSTAGGISTKTQREEISKLIETLNLLRANYDKVEGAASKMIDLRKRIADLKNISVRNLTDDNLDTQAKVNERIALLQKESSAQIKYSEVWNRIQALKAVTFKTASKEIEDSQLTSIAEIRKRITELSKLPGSAEDGSIINSRIDALKARLKELGNSGDAADKAALKARNDLQKSIDDLVKKGTDKQLNADAQEVESVRKKYSDMQDAANAFNENPDNKKKGLRVNEGGLSSARANELTALADKQDTEKLKVTLDTQKALYDDFESYKTKVGEQEANKRYADQIKTDRTYLQSLQDKREALVNDNEKAKGGADPRDIAAVQLQLKLVDERIAAEVLANKKKDEDIYANAYQAALTNSQALLGIEAEYQRNIIALGESATEEQTNNLKRQRDEKIDAIGVSMLQELDAYKDLYDNIDSLSTKQATKDIATLRGAASISLALGKISLSSFKGIIKSLDGAETNIKDRLPAGLKKVASGFSAVGDEVGKFDEGLGNAINSLSKMLSLVADIKSNLNTLKSPDADLFSKASSSLGLLGAGISIAQGIASLFDNSAKLREQAEYSSQLQVKQAEAINKLLERQLALTKEIYGPQRISEYIKSLGDIKKAQADATASIQASYQLTGDKMLDEVIGRVNTSSTQGFDLAIFKQAYDAFKKAGIDLQLGNKSLEDLQRLLDAGKLDEKTSALVNSLVALKDQYTDTMNALRAETTGTTFDSIADEIVSMFENATTSAEDFGKNFEKIMQKSILNSFKRNSLEKQLQGFYEQFALASESNGGLDAGEISALQANYEKVIEDAKKQFEDLEKATGVKFAGTDTDSPSSMVGRVTPITENTAGELIGQFNGQRVATLQLVQYSSQNLTLLQANSKTLGDLYNSTISRFEELQKIEANTLRTANNTDRLESIEKALASIDKKTGAAGNALAANGRPI
jgi:tape measure domain-containing protein